MTIDQFFYFFDLLGTFVFALSGAIAGLRKRLDIYGVFILAVVTALGGGTIRDVLLGRNPPVVFTDLSYLAISALAWLVMVLFHRRVEKLRSILKILDALGLGIFTVIGAKVSLSLGGSWFASAMLGIITGTGGGMVRDVLRGEVPLVLQKEIYAVASLAGAVFYVLWRDAVGLEESVGALLAAGVCAGIRILAIFFNWHLPVIKYDADDDQDPKAGR